MSIAMRHPVRLEYLKQVKIARKLTPADFSRSVRLPLSNVSFHVGALRDAGMVAEAETFQVRGSLAHAYKLTPMGHKVIKVVEEI